MNLGILNWVYRTFDRRKDVVPVTVERREARPTRQSAEKRMCDAVDDFERTVCQPRNKLFGDKKL